MVTRTILDLEVVYPKVLGLHIYPPTFPLLPGLLFSLFQITSFPLLGFSFYFPQIFWIYSVGPGDGRAALCRARSRSGYSSQHKRFRSNLSTYKFASSIARVRSKQLNAEMSDGQTVLHRSTPSHIPIDRQYFF